MEQIKIKDIDIYKGFDGTVRLSMRVDEEFTARALNAVSSANERLVGGKEVGIVIDRLKKSRSLSANAYFHVLCDKIAAVLSNTADEVKTQLVVRYGTPLYSVTIPETADIGKLWRYYKWIGTAIGMSTYLLYQHTHLLDTKEMSRLIEGTIDEAQQLGIETKTPQEIAEIMQRWEEEYGKAN